MAEIVGTWRWAVDEPVAGCRFMEQVGDCVTLRLWDDEFTWTVHASVHGAGTLVANPERLAKVFLERKAAAAGTPSGR